MLLHPGTLQELMDQFPTEKACTEYLEQLRWQNGFECPKCGADKSWEMDRGLRLCAGCRRQVSVKANTIFHDSKLGLKTWFYAIWWFTNQKSGASALGLQRALGLRRYETAWLMLHKLRVAMIRPYRDRLSGDVEVDEAYIGGEGNKELVGIAAEIRGPRTGRIRMERIADRSGPTLQGFVKRHIEPGSTIVTDGLKSYFGVKSLGYSHKPMHKPHLLKHQNPDADELLPRVHRVISLVKRWLLGTYQGAVEKKYLDVYLNEFTFRFNRRTSRSRGLLFRRLLENIVALDPVLQNDIKR